jgi:hypothetical protein
MEVELESLALIPLIPHFGVPHDGTALVLSISAEIPPQPTYRLAYDGFSLTFDSTRRNQRRTIRSNLK